jgi:hypothetical protein
MPLYPCMHPYVLHHPWRNLFCLEGYLLGSALGGLFLCFFVFLSLSCLPGLDQLSFHQEKVLHVDMGFLKSHVDMRDSCPHTKNPI